ncbi:3-isopropylmalate dehydrogenase leu2a [Niveomyces insectorum RCEF 264]|uniref:3-isopropylmalate dehydrogenase leu2a n=1 Tax=Niveomyces insectorum RCEF 264 TaxID=1081102 RepID=A0A167RGZ3_9HYPO|nr:3-isopropylmalate dehydrogenase leu2a [Niveomyces insectorum RCEF 264]
MSGNQLATSFGDSTAQPPTPKQTPTSTTSSFFPSPVFETPKINFSHASHTTTTTPGPDWTPRFAEGFSVFNTTPGSLSGSQGPFADFEPPFTPSTTCPSESQPSFCFSTTSNQHRKHTLSISSFAAEIATAHAHLPFSNPNLPLPPVEPSKRLSSSPNSLVLATLTATVEPENNNQAKSDGVADAQAPVASDNLPARRKPKKARCNTTTAATKDSPTSETALLVHGRTATPPPSAKKGAKKGARKLAPKLLTSTMQSDQGYGPQQPLHPDFMTTPNQQHMAAFVGSPADLFNYPLSAPATASAFADARTFWEGGDANMSAMEVDYSAAGSHIFHTPSSMHRQLESIDWSQSGQANQAYMMTGVDASAMSQQGQQHLDNHLQQMPLSADNNSKQMMHPTLDMSSVDQPALYAGGYPTPVDDPFGIVSPNGGVNPGLLFSRPASSNMDTMASAPPGAPTMLTGADSATFDPTPQPPSSSAPAVLRLPQNSPPPALPAMPVAAVRSELRRSSSAKEIAPRRKAGDRAAPASSPIKPTARPSLARSFSDTRGPRLRGRASLPTLAPAIKPPPALSIPHEPAFSSPGTGLGITRSASFGGGRPTGRSSPIRMHYQRQQQLDQPHQRLSSLTSIPEVHTPRSRTAVKFTIDANGRARVETTLDADDESAPPSTLRRNQSARSLHSKSGWESSSEDDSSSTDDEPIIIPSRTTSFALPDPVKPRGRGPLHSSQRSVSDRSTASTFATLPGDASYNDPESEAETVMNEVPKGAGDAAGELEKLRQMRQKRSTLAGGGKGGSDNVFSSGQRGLRFGGSFGGNANSHNSSARGRRQAVSPTTLTETSLPTPSSDTHSHGVRCICGRTEPPGPSDGFIVQCESCEFWLHGLCINITKRTLPSVYICAYCAETPNMRGVRMPPAGAASSPLAHKSLKTFR